MISKLGHNGDEETIAEAKKRFTAHCDGTSVLPADLRGPVSIGSLFTKLQQKGLFSCALTVLTFILQSLAKSSLKNSISLIWRYADFTSCL